MSWKTSDDIQLWSITIDNVFQVFSIWEFYISDTMLTAFFSSNCEAFLCSDKIVGSSNMTKPAQSLKGQDHKGHEQKH